MILFELAALQHLCGIRQHGCGFPGGDRLLRQECAAGQRKPAPVDGDLDVAGICNGFRFAEGVFRILSQPEAQGEVQRMGRKFPGRRILRAEIRAGQLVDQTKLHRHQNIPVIWLFARQVGIIIIRIVVLLHRHGEGLDHGLNPLRPGHLRIRSPCRKRRQRQQAAQNRQKEHDADPLFLHSNPFLCNWLKNYNFIVSKFIPDVNAA